MTHFLLGLAQAAPAAGGGAAGGGGSLVTSMFPFILIFGVMYFMLIRPQAKKQKELQKMLSELKQGDDVVTNGGLIGRISGIKDDVITLQVQEQVRIRVLRSAVTGRYTPGAAAAKADVKAS